MIKISLQSIHFSDFFPLREFEAPIMWKSLMELDWGFSLPKVNNFFHTRSDRNLESNVVLIKAFQNLGWTIHTLCHKTNLFPIFKVEIGNKTKHQISIISLQLIWRIKIQAKTNI